jgi:hypothetical protein
MAGNCSSAAGNWVTIHTLPSPFQAGENRNRERRKTSSHRLSLHLPMAGKNSLFAHFPPNSTRPELFLFAYRRGNSVGWLSFSALLLYCSLGGSSSQGPLGGSVTFCATFSAQYCPLPYPFLLVPRCPRFRLSRANLILSFCAKINETTRGLFSPSPSSFPRRSAQTTVVALFLFTETHARSWSWTVLPATLSAAALAPPDGPSHLAEHLDRGPFLSAAGLTAIFVACSPKLSAREPSRRGEKKRGDQTSSES